MDELRSSLKQAAIDILELLKQASMIDKHELAPFRRAPMLAKLADAMVAIREARDIAELAS